MNPLWIIAPDEEMLDIGKENAADLTRNFSMPEENIRPLPAHLVERYCGWKSTTFSENQVSYRRLADEGQRPFAMIIACCDSRVNMTHTFAADAGEFFVHRNIASLVPPCEPDGGNTGTPAAIEYGVTALKVAHLIVVGHSQCGGVAGCHAMCSGNAPELEKSSSFVGRWLDILKPGYDKVAAEVEPDKQIRALEHEAVILSLKNLMTFPFVSSAVEDGNLTLHGLWNDIGAGELLQYDPEVESFQPV